MEKKEKKLSRKEEKLLKIRNERMDSQKSLLPRRWEDIKKRSTKEVVESITDLINFTFMERTISKNYSTFAQITYHFQKKEGLCSFAQYPNLMDKYKELITLWCNDNDFNVDEISASYSETFGRIDYIYIGINWHYLL
jgi:hypothetical protein